MKITTIITAAMVLMTAQIGHATEYTFDVNSKFINISFESQMDIEDILGTTTSLSGSVVLDEPVQSFSLTVPVASLKTGIDMRDEHLRSEGWLNSARFPDISFTGKSITKKAGDKFLIAGDFELKGIKKSMTVEADLRKIPAAAAAKLGLDDADWIRVRATFKVKLSDFGVKIPEMAAAKVSDTWTIKVSIFGKAK